MASKRILVTVSVRDDGGEFFGDMKVNQIQSGRTINIFDFSSLSTVSEQTSMQEAANAAGQAVRDYIIAAFEQNIEL